MCLLGKDHSPAFGSERRKSKTNQNYPDWQAKIGRFKGNLPYIY